MPTKLTMVLNSEDISYNSASTFHGALMDVVDHEYADYLHSENIRPFSQSISKLNDKYIWTVNTCNARAKENIIDKLLSEKFNSLHLTHKDSDIEITEKICTTISYKELFEKNYFDSNSQSRTIVLKTPTSFKSNGRYINIPSVRLLFQSLINKYDACSDFTSVYDDNLIEEFESNLMISRYFLRSAAFHLEGVSVPSFLGDITFRSFGSQKLTSLMNMLLEFGTYSGIGIKSALGMGACQIKEFER